MTGIQLARPLAGAAVALTCLLAACDNGDRPPPASAHATGATGQPAITATRPTPASQPAAPSAPPSATSFLPTATSTISRPSQTDSSTPQGARPTTPASRTTPDPERHGDPVRGVRSISGTVQRFADCTVLRTASRTWALLGPMVAPMRPGQRADVRGTVSSIPRGCPAGGALQVTSAGLG